MQSVMRGVCIAYAVFLTMLLLSRDPTTVIGCHGCLPRILAALLPMAHFLSFVVLAVLMLAVRWSLPRWSLVVVMAIYGGATEIIQGFVPPRTPDWSDWLQDLGGIVVGSLACWAICALVAAHGPCRRTLEAVSIGVETQPVSPRIGALHWWGLKRSD